jgi:endoribonuclease LACTB2
MIRDSMFGTRAADVERWSDLVVVVRGLNPGPFTGPGTNTYLVGRSASPVLIDTGQGVDGYPVLLAAALRDEFGAERPREILLTHGHRDHQGGVKQLAERFGACPVSKLPWREKDLAAGIPLVEIEDGARIEVDGAHLRAVHCPGHAPDHLCFYLEEERALFTGDVVLGAGTTIIPLEGGDLRAYMASLERILELELARIYPGHGPRIDAPVERVREYIEHRLERERQIMRALRGGATTVQEVVERVYVDTPRALYPAAAQSVLSHLRKLEIERRAQQRVDAGGEAHWSLS